MENDRRQGKIPTCSQPNLSLSSSISLSNALYRTTRTLARVLWHSLESGIAYHLENGRSFARASVMDTGQEGHRDATDKSREHNDGRVRMEERER